MLPNVKQPSSQDFIMADPFSQMLVLLLKCFLSFLTEPSLVAAVKNWPGISSKQVWTPPWTT